MTSTRTVTRAHEWLAARVCTVRFWLAVVALSVGAGAVWLVVTGLYARAELTAAQRGLAGMRQSFTGAPEPGAGDGRTAGGAGSRREQAGAMGAVSAHTAAARRWTSGPVWSVAAHVPFVGGPMATVRGAADIADQLAHEVLPPLVGVVSGAGEGGVEGAMSALEEKAPALQRASRAASRVREQAGKLPQDTWLPAVDRVRNRLAVQTDVLATAMADAAVAGRVLPGMLGGEAPRRYFVVFQNTAEARGTGGVAGAFAVLTATRGHLAFESFGNNTLLESARIKPDVDLGTEFAAQYAGNDPTGTWANSNISPHFPYAARIWAATWTAYSGQRLDGVVALDPSALGLLLAAAGPAQLPDGSALTGGNVVDLTERIGYARYADVVRRKAFFLDVARAAAVKLTEAVDDAHRLPALLASAREVVAQERLKVWSADPAEQRLLETRPLGGALPRGGPFAGLVVNNAAGGKLDYYLRRQMQWIPGRCTERGREVTVRIRLHNGAPTSGLPDYVTLRGDEPAYRTRAGDNRLLVSYYASPGAGMDGATLDGRPITASSVVERSHPVFTADVELPAGTSRTLTFRLVEPIDDRAPSVWRQALVSPLEARVEPYPACH
ncbi:DUF4012 domain-containing protein [Streptomyces sp. NPDC059175]|uniref:DUF4012 domain-containing protein n=1 Tax=Streptomyces sp. NPDC059175 TaxID=3346757 RepID=UPI0036B185C7